MPEQSQQRQVAVKLRISDISNGSYVVEEGWNPNYVLTKKGIKASRVNLFGVVITSPTTDANYKSIAIDDGSGNISVRSFDEGDMFQGVSLGDAVFIVGRPRQYGNEVYLMPEIVKKIENTLWIEVRKKELEKISAMTPVEAVQTENVSSVAQTIDEEQPFKSASEEEIVEDIPLENETPKVEEPKNEGVGNSQKIYNLIRELDKGDGALFEEILEKSGVSDAEKIISQLLMEGEIFELSKGKLKVLE